MLDRIQGCLLGVMIGDALGMPVEMMTPEAILKATNNKGIVGFIDPIQTRIEGTKKLSAGQTTDDWQSTKAILTSLIRRGEFDLTDVAMSHLDAFDTSTFGWGNSTKDGLEEIKKYFSSYGREGRSIYVRPASVEKRGLGNGVAMKIAPMALFEAMLHPHTRSDKVVRLFDKSIAFDFIYLAERVAAIGRLTHSNPRAWAAAYAVALIIGETMIFKAVADTIDQPVHKNWLLERLIKKVTRFEGRHDITTDGFADRLKILLKGELLFGPIEHLRKVVGTGCNSLESVCFAIALFLRNPKDFRKALLEAVNAGGDTDSVASILGGMIGSVVGLKGIPKDWAEFIPDFKQATVLGSEFHSVFSK